MKNIYQIKKRKSLLPCFLIFLVGGLWAQVGTIDTTFGNKGVVLTDINAGSQDRIHSLMVQPDGKIVAVGTSYKGRNYNGALIRLLEDGSLDPDFGTGGIVTLDFVSDVFFWAAALDKNQNIIAAGLGNEGDFITARYLPNGLLDESFGTDGIVLEDFFSGEDYANAVVIQADGTIVVAGAGTTTNNPNDSGLALIRLNSDGSLDTTFGDQGKVLTPMGPGWEEIKSLVVQADGKLIAIGNTDTAGDAKFCLARYHPDGSLDPTFGTNGIVVDSFLSGYNNVQWIDLMPDEKIVLVGRAGQEEGVARYHTDGSPDSTFNGTGKLMIDPAVRCNGLSSGLVTADGKLLIGGSAGATGSFLLGRINPDGSIDTTFGDNGFLKNRITLNSSNINSMAATPDGNFFAAGYGSGEVVGNFSFNFAVVKYLNGLEVVGTQQYTSPAQEVLVYPNPIVDQTVLYYNLEKEQRITIRLLDAVGKPIKTFVQDQWQAPGSYQQAITIPGTLPSGLYLLQISSPHGQVSIKVMK